LCALAAAVDAFDGDEFSTSSHYGWSVWGKVRCVSMKVQFNRRESALQRRAC
jgi:hypothetical protein